MSTAIAEDIRSSIVADYLTGMPQIAVAERYGVGAASVHRIIKAAGAERGRKFHSDILDAAVDDYLGSGDSIRVVATRHPLSEDTLRIELRKRDLTRPSGATTATTVKNAAIDDFLAGMSIAQVSDKHGIARSTISAWLSQENVGAEDREDTSPVDYDGGWVLRGGVRYPVKPVRRRVAA